MGDHEGPGVEVSVGDGVNLVDLGIVLYVEVVVARVGRKSEYNLVKPKKVFAVIQIGQAKELTF